VLPDICKKPWLGCSPPPPPPPHVGRFHDDWRYRSLADLLGRAIIVTHGSDSRKAGVLQTGLTPNGRLAVTIQARNAGPIICWTKKTREKQLYLASVPKRGYNRVRWLIYIESGRLQSGQDAWADLYFAANLKKRRAFYYPELRFEDKAFKRQKLCHCSGKSPGGHEVLEGRSRQNFCTAGKMPPSAWASWTC